MNYSIGCAFSVKDLFINFPYKSLKANCADSYKAIKDNHRDKLVQRIFKDSVELILNDVIDNNVTFLLPTNNKIKADIHMQQIRGEKFRNLKRNGKWKDLSLIASDFTGYLLGLFMYGNRTPRVKNIYVLPEMRDRIIENVNNGMTYC